MLSLASIPFGQRRDCECRKADESRAQKSFIQV